MTTKVVADDVLGQIALKQWELFRRAKEGSLHAPTVLSALQGIIENQVEQFDIEKLNWTVSSRVHEISVEEGADFVTSVKNAGYMWSYNNEPLGKFTLEGNAKRKKRKERFRLAQVNSECELGVVKTYAQLAGFHLGSSWELLSFVRQSAVTRVLKDGARFVALGDYGRTTYSDSSGSPICCVSADAYLKGRNWSFDTVLSGENQEKLNRERVARSYHILLKEW